MYNLLKSGAAIIISMKKYISTVFYMEGNTIHCYNAELGDCQRDDLTAEQFNAHCENMIRQGGQIQAFTYTNKQAEIINAMYKRNAKERAALDY